MKDIRRLLSLIADYSVGALIRVLDAISGQTTQTTPHTTDHMDQGPS